MNEEEHWDYVDCLQHSIQTPPSYMDGHTVGGGRDWLQILTGVMLWVVTLLGAVFAHHMMSAWTVAGR